MSLNYMRLPDGSYTKDTRVYGLAWKELGERAARFFEGYEAIAYDPMIRLDRKDRRDPKWSGKTTYFDITVEAALALRVPQ